MNAILAGIIGVWEIILVVACLFFIGFPIWMIVDCAIHETSASAKAIWIVGMVLLGVIIAVPYYFACKLRRSIAPTTTDGQ